MTQGERHEADLVVQAKFRDQPLCFLIHVEAQARPETDFPRRMFRYFGFVDSYLRLTMEQEGEFEAELAAVEMREKDKVMEIVTSWMEKGLEKGREEGREEGQQQEARLLVLRQLRKRVGGLDEAAEARIEALPTQRLEELGEALLDFHGPNDLTVWLQEHSE